MKRRSSAVVVLSRLAKARRAPRLGSGLRWTIGLAASIGAATALPAPALAWNDLGHMTVAAVAWSRMTPETRRRASALLKLNPQYPRWIAGTAPRDRDAITFVRAATWSDHIKDLECQRPPATPTSGCYRNSGYTPANARENINIGYADRDLRLYWHFKNVAFSNDGTPLALPFEPNAETQIALFTSAIGNSALSEEARSFDLTWLLHLVGDIHQPLHAVARFSSDDRDGDHGGNDIRLCPPERPVQCTRQESRTFHSYWDGALGTGRNPKTAFAIAARYEGYAPKASERTAPVSEWVAESVEAAKRSAYVAPIGPQSATYAIAPDSTYARNAGSIAEQRVRLAGVRLGEILNRNLK